MLKSSLMTKFAFGLFLSIVLLISAGCGSQSPPLEVIDLNLPRSEVRDAVRDGATLSNGEVLFSRIENDYGFVDDHFHLDGLANTDAGTTYDAFIDVTFVVEDEALRLEIANHNLQLDDDEVERLNAAISAEFMRSVADTIGREIHRYDAVEIGENGLVVTLRVEPMPGVVPLNP